MRKPSLEYIAGFFDGEGCIGVYLGGSKRSHFLSVQITQNDGELSRPLMNYILYRWGGSISEQTTLSGKTKLGYAVTGDSALKLLKEINPYLILKRPQAELAIDWQGNRETWNKRDERGRMTLRPERLVDHDRSVAKAIKDMKK